MDQQVQRPWDEKGHVCTKNWAKASVAVSERWTSQGGCERVGSIVQAMQGLVGIAENSCYTYPHTLTEFQGETLAGFQERVF